MVIEHYTCKNCLCIFTTPEALQNHQEICVKHKYCKVKMPIENKTGEIPILKFEKHHFKSRLPVVIYADFEALNLKLQTVKPSDKQSYNTPIFKQEVISFGIYIKSDFTLT